MSTATSTRCKFTVTNILNHGPADGNSPYTVTLQAQYDPELSKEDHAFSTATPSGTMTAVINNPRLNGFFQEGQAYYLDITPVANWQDK